MCNSKNSIPSVNKAEGQNSNADTNSVNIYETIQNHSSTVTICLVIIVIILIGHFLFKLYTFNKSAIKRNEQSKRLTRVMSKLALEDEHKL